jgi:hypothetical protein
LDELFQTTENTPLALLFSLKHDFPSEWAKFNSDGNTFTATIRRDYFPYFSNGKDITINTMTLYDGSDTSRHHELDAFGDVDNLNNKEKRQQFTFSMNAGNDRILKSDAKEVFLLIRYTLDEQWEHPGRGTLLDPGPLKQSFPKG